MRVRSCCFRLDFSSFNNGNSRTCNARCKYAFEGALLVELENILYTPQGSLIREKVNNNTVRANAWNHTELTNHTFNLKIFCTSFRKKYEAKKCKVLGIGCVRSCCFRLVFSAFNNGKSRTCRARCIYAFEGALKLGLQKIFYKQEP